ncbi:hypothetical protein WJX81_005801 [Elliptochloris bilobata]|uniref:Mitochondrial carrier protein n=1 Tax=Elliptochloris bilobata TaxID=381761 RepID=A0AAW1S9H4_9CHLO
MPPTNDAGYLQVVKDIFAGTCGGIAVTLVGHPFDTAKVRLQTQSARKPIYSGVFDVVRKTIQWEGPQGLYKGVTSPLAGQMFFRATQFGAFGWAKRWLATNPDGSARLLTALDFYKAGAITGFLATFIEGPIDFYKSQIQYQIIRAKSDPSYKPAFTTVSGCVAATLRQNGARGPFQGLGATLVRNTPANAIYLGSFEALKRRAAESYRCRPEDLPSWVVVSAAGIGGLLYWLAIFPVDQVKSAMQTDAIDPAQRRYPTMTAAVQRLWEEGGARRFYKGFTPCLLRAVPANGVMLLTVDKERKLRAFAAKANPTGQVSGVLAQDPEHFLKDAATATWSLVKTEQGAADASEQALARQLHGAQAEAASAAAQGGSGGRSRGRSAGRLQKRAAVGGSALAGGRLVGMACDVWWEGEGQFFAGVMAEYNPAQDTYRVDYDDGDVDLALRLLEHEIA